MAEQREYFMADVSRFVAPQRRPRGVRLALKILSEPGLQFAAWGRLQAVAEARDRRNVARILHILNLRLTGGEWGAGSRVLGGLVVKHPLGVVIGGGTVIGADCTVLHNVVFGEVRPADSSMGKMLYPTIGDRCLIGNGAAVLGAIILGDDVTVGAGAVVLGDVADLQTVVGMPARPIRTSEDSAG